MPKVLKTFKTEDEYLIVMEDLASLGFSSVVTEASKTHLKTCLSWLANFHASHMGRQSSLIWKTGTYWHLDTRPDEFEVLEDITLKEFAFKIDMELKNAKYQTIVHGDAKLANFCFSKDASLVAAVDFQYVGHGCGMKDVILFMSSAVLPEDCNKIQDWVLNTYFKAFNEAIEYYQPKLDAREIEKEWRDLFCVSWADFQRFIKAWSPKHFKINSYSENLTKSAVKYLKTKEK